MNNTPLPDNDMYQTYWDPRAYLRQYFSRDEVAGETRSMYAFIHAFLLQERHRTDRGGGIAVDFGCGPVPACAFALTPYVHRICFADYVSANLDEIRRWLRNAPGAHNWSGHIKYLLALETGGDPTPEQVRQRAEELRNKAGELLPADVRKANPLGEPRVFDLVMSNFCIEAVGTDRDAWARYLSHLCSMVMPGGSLLMTAVRRCRSYEVLGRTFPATYVDEDDFARELPKLGFERKNLVIESAAVPDWTDEGFDGICLVAGRKRR